MFWKRQNNVDLREINAKIEAFNKKIAGFEVRLMDIESSHDLIRDKILRRFQQKRHSEEEKEEEKRNLDGLPRFSIT